VSATLTGAAARRERGRQEMRATILDATRALIASKGVEAVTMRDVAQAIGYSVASLYEYFPAKDAILTCLYFEGTEGLAGRLSAALTTLPGNATATERLAALGQAYRAYAHEQPELFRLIFFRQEPNPARPKDGAGEDAFGLLLSVAQDGIDRGEFAPVPVEALAVTAWTIVHGFVMLELGEHLRNPACPSPLTLVAEPGLRDEAMLNDLFAQVLRLGMTGIMNRPSPTAANGRAPN